MRVKYETHKMYNSSTYSSWCRMKRRCLNPKNPRFKDYGGRGIKVCKEWLRFKGFFESMGIRPEGKSIDRIDNDGNYEPGNCKWSTSLEQSSNRRNNNIITYKGVSLHVSAWSRRLGINRSTFAKRLSRGWTIKEAIERLAGSKEKRHDSMS